MWHGTNIGYSSSASDYRCTPWIGLLMLLDWLISLSTVDDEELVKYWEKVSSFTSRSKILPHLGIPKLTPLDGRLLLKNHHSVRK